MRIKIDPQFWSMAIAFTAGWAGWMLFTSMSGTDHSDHDHSEHAHDHAGHDH